MGMKNDVMWSSDFRLIVFRNAAVLTVRKDAHAIHFNILVSADTINKQFVF